MEEGRRQEEKRKEEGRNEEGADRFLSRERKTYSSQFNLNVKNKKGDDHMKEMGRTLRYLKLF